MDEIPLIEDIRIQQRFILAGQTYVVLNVAYDFDHDHYVVVSRSEEPILHVMLELKIKPRTPFRTLH